MNMNQVITISRQFGSGGRTIGKETADKLGIPCYDEEIINQIAEKSGFAKEFIKESGEYTASTSWIGNIFASRDYNGHSVQEDLWHMQSRIVEELAEKGPCVIVGRCADYILRDKAELLTVFIHASMEKRAERIVNIYGEDKEQSAEKRLLNKDKRRKAYYQLYTDTKWGDAKNYDVSLDSGRLGIDTCVSILTELYQQMKRE